MKKMMGAAATVLLLAGGVANADDLPELKEGLWSIHMHTVDNPGNKISDHTSTICRNHAYDAHTRTLAKNVKGCTTVNESFHSGTYSVQTHCVVGATVIDSKGLTTIQGDSSAHSETHSTYTPAMAGTSETTMVMDQKYAGSCPAGLQPGDRTTEDGRVTHLWKH
jgi:hypothetical protein